jgi:mannose-1-phosphate guanylyltransferase
MRAFLLAGGLGERLRPLTLSRPKCLVPINGVPLLRIWLDHCLAEGITDVLLNVSQHPQLVQSFLEQRAHGSGCGRARTLGTEAPCGQP